METTSLLRKRLRNVWRHMIYRCHNQNADDFGRYGAKGVAVCHEWRDSFPAFYEWAISNGYRAGLTIDRRKGTIGYSPQNCRWATTKQQQMNRGKGILRKGSRFKGVRKMKNRYNAQIKVDGTCRHLGMFDSEEAAANAYDRAALQHFGEFASLNFPVEAVA